MDCWKRLRLLTFQNSACAGSQEFLGDSISGGYSNVQNITTFAGIDAAGRVSSYAEGGRGRTRLSITLQYRRVAVDPDSLQVSANLIPQLSQPVRVGGPGITWFHDTRQPSPLDAVRGSYTSVQEFLASFEVRLAGELQPGGRDQFDVLRVWQAEVCAGAQYADGI